MTALKSEVVTLKTDVSALKSDTSYLKQLLDQNRRESMSTILQIRDMLSEDIKPLYCDVDSLKNRVTKLEKAVF